MIISWKYPFFQLPINSNQQWKYCMTNKIDSEKKRQCSFHILCLPKLLQQQSFLGQSVTCNCLEFSTDVWLLIRWSINICLISPSSTRVVKLSRRVKSQTRQRSLAHVSKSVASPGTCNISSGLSLIPLSSPVVGKCGPPAHKWPASGAK